MFFRIYSQSKQHIIKKIKLAFEYFFVVLSNLYHHTFFLFLSADQRFAQTFASFFPRLRIRIRNLKKSWIRSRFFLTGAFGPCFFLIDSRNRIVFFFFFVLFFTKKVFLMWMVGIGFSWRSDPVCLEGRTRIRSFMENRIRNLMISTRMRCPDITAASRRVDSRGFFQTLLWSGLSE